MSLDVVVEDFGQGFKEGLVINVLVKEGQEVKKGDTLIFIETEKMVIEIDAPKSGIIKKIHCKPGDMVRNNDRLITIG